MIQLMNRHVLLLDEVDRVLSLHCLNQRHHLPAWVDDRPGCLQREQVRTALRQSIRMRAFPQVVTSQHRPVNHRQLLPEYHPCVCR